VTGACLLCQPNETVPLAEILDHLRLIHPSQWDGLETWPDGSPVIYEDTELFWLEAGE
jgi:hypothetical protein